VDCFTCPEPANYAAIALQLQKTALDAENCIYPLEAQLRAAANRPTMVNISSTAPSIAPSTRTRFADSTTVTFSNSPDLSVQNVLPAGIYEAGVWLNATASGATTDNSFRQVEIVTRGLNDPSVIPDDSTVANVMYESSSGLGMDMLLNTTVFLDGTQRVQFYFTHNNASNIIIAAGAIFWITKISDSAIPRVVI
jgi:hypothetical protein